MKQRLKGLIGSFTGIIVGTSLIPNIGTGVAAVGGVAGKVLRPVPSLFAIGVLGAAKGSKKAFKW